MDSLVNQLQSTTVSRYNSSTNAEKMNHPQQFMALTSRNTIVCMATVVRPP
jgi:hypothetical protein